VAELCGRVAIISGGLGDIGAAIARELARGGAHVALGDILPADRAAGLIGEIGALGRSACYHRVDVSDAEAVRAWVAAAEDEMGPPDIIVPNAARVTLEGVRTVTPEQWNREMRVNLDGAFHLAQAAALRLLHHVKPGRIVFIGSWAAEAVHLGLPAYSVAKAGLRMLMRCMALDLAPAGILVNEVAPGFVDAGLSGKIFAEYPEERAKALAKVPIKKLITPEDVAWEVAHLCDPRTAHVTGTVLLMDGGLSLVTPGGARNE
jgi:glucose 1-dehydrogenase